MKKLFLTFLFLLTLAFNASAGAVHAGHEGHASPTGHAPIGVMADHMHKQGEWMVSYRHMYMDMDELYAGSKNISKESVHNEFMIAPTKMNMHMHMVGMMYGLTDEVTLMAMLPYHFKSMSHVRRTDGKTFTTRTEGIGDLKLTGMFSLERYLNKKVQFNFGVSMPTGSIGERDATLMGPDRKLPYPMQLGSGTFDLLPGLTYSDTHDKWNWGTQVSSVVRNGRNEHKYTLGNEYRLTTWIAYEWLDWFSTSFRVNATKRGHIRGRDHQLNASMVPTADPNNYAHERLDLLFGTNIVIPSGIFKDHRLALEIGFPAYIHAEGPQLMTDLTTTIGWQKAF